MRVKPQSLAQDELDDSYHLAYFECEHAASRAVVALFENTRDKTLRDAVIDKICEAMHECEVKHLGPRYDALMERLQARKNKAGPQ
jgi:hypothetical protein